jgi:ribosomal-protein-alanine N-acetyltransferase
MTPEGLAATHAAAFTETRAWGADEFASLLADPKCFVAGDVSSFVLMRVIADEAEVLTLATAPEHRRKGLARAALAQAETEAAQRGATSVFLEVAEDNPAARALYAACGYGQVGRRAGYYTPKKGAPVAALVLRKDIAAK